jgi:DEAD/DEAH box helicase domain-containing protein
VVRGYRGGYLRDERRAIEAGLRSGAVRAVAATNALELGVDIGGLEACIMAGYPGTIAATWQQAGRAGRGEAPSAAFVIASASPLDQYIVTHADYFFGQSPERAHVNPDNLYLLLGHVRCAAAELPFEDGEPYGNENLGEILAYLQENGEVRHTGGRWSGRRRFAGRGLSLRAARGAGADSRLG